ncbi:MAG: beta-N-acetylhexosaminidase [Polyangiaceae bacterium]
MTISSVPPSKSRSQSLAKMAGRVLVAGFSGTQAPGHLVDALRDETLGGVILFARNLEAGPAENGTPTTDLRALAALTTALRVAGSRAGNPLVAIDQEGGRVARVKAPAMVLPPARVLAERFDDAALARIVRAQGQELLALGITWNFAPVLDVHTRPENPIIGDRAFGDDPIRAAQAALAFESGLRGAGILTCGKHFPGHGDTTKDSHLELPEVDHPRERLVSVELEPFARAIGAGVPSLMSAHVLYPALDPSNPATLSRAIATDLLRGRMGFRGVLVSDDLEMRALSDRMDIETSSTAAIEAGCDALLVCSNRELAERAHRALVRRAETDDGFRDRLHEASERVMALRRSSSAHDASRPFDPVAFERIGREARELVHGPKASRSVPPRSGA